MAVTADILRSKFGFNDPNVIEGILRDPGQVARYEREMTPAAPSVISAPSSDNFFAQQKSEEDDFLNRFRGVVSGQEKLPALAERIGGELGLPSLRQSAFNLNQTLANIPTVQTQATTGFDVNENQRQRKIAAEQAKIAPLAQKATSQQQFAEGQLGERLGYETSQQLKDLQPFNMEASLLSDRLARETTGYTQDKQSELDIYLRKLDQGFQLSQSEKLRAQELADAESTFEKQRELLTLQTNEEIRKSKALQQGSGTGNFTNYLPPKNTGKQPLPTLWDSLG